MRDLTVYRIEKGCSFRRAVKPGYPILSGGRGFHQAFTLLEILIAISMIGLIMATVLGTFMGVMSSSRDATKKAELCQTGRAVMDLICADIRGFVPLTVPEGGVSFHGVSERDENDVWTCKANFVTTHSLPIGIEPNLLLSEVGYTVKRDPNEHLYSLWRRAQYPPEYPYDEGGKEVPVCRIIESFHLEFVDPNGTNLSLSHSAPTAVVVYFTLNLDGEREDFVTMTRPMIGAATSSVSPVQVPKQ